MLQELGDETKGSARSYGDFSAADAIRAADDIITKGGGHKLAAGVTMPTKNIDAFRQRVNEYFHSLALREQPVLLLPHEEVSLDTLDEVGEELITQIAQLEPFGHGNPEPILKMEITTVTGVRHMGSDAQHLKLEVQDKNRRSIELLAFNAPSEWSVGLGEQVSVWFVPTINEWRGRRSVEGRLVRLESVDVD